MLLQWMVNGEICVGIFSMKDLKKVGSLTLYVCSVILNSSRNCIVKRPTIFKVCLMETLWCCDLFKVNTVINMLT